MTVGLLVRVIFEEFRAGRITMQDEVPVWMFHPGYLPRMEAEEYINSKGVGVHADSRKARND